MARVPKRPEDSPSRLRPVSWDPQPGRRSIGRLLRLLAGALRLMIEASPWITALSLAMQVLSAFATAVALLFVRRVVAALTTGPGGDAAFGSLAGGLLGLGLTVAAIGVLAALQRQAQTVLTEHMTWRASERVYDAATTVELAAYDVPAFYDRLERAQTGYRVPELSQSVLSLLTSATMTLSILAVLLVLQPVLVVVPLVALVPLGLVSGLDSRQRHELSVLLAQNDRKRGYVRAVLTNRDFAKEVRSLGMAPFVRDLSRQLFVERMGYVWRSVRRGGLLAALGGLGDALGVTGALGILVYLVLTHRLGLASATAAIAALVQLGTALSNVAIASGTVYQTALFVEDYRAFCDRAAGGETPRRPAPRRFSRLVAERLTFAYPGAARPALEDVSIELRQGEIVALVGVNGSGKTTLAKLLCRLYAPDAGRILWDGTDLADVDFDELRQAISVVFQDFGRYLFTAAENIGLGRIDRMDNRDALVAAARQAGAHDFITALPAGYDTNLGSVFEVGADLSVGQWQRIALARAFFRDAPFIILDEPTASLDARAEHELFSSIRTLCAGRTVLLVSHRFSTTSTADRIYVLDGGRVVEHGSHADLVRAAGQYAELFGLQSRQYLAVDAFPRDGLDGGRVQDGAAAGEA